MAEIQNTIQEQEEESLDIRALLNKCIEHWKWFVVSVVICVGIGTLYLLKTPKQFERSAILVIKDESGGNTSQLAAMAANFGVGGMSSKGGTNVNNELAILQAPAYIMETEKKLGMEMSYSIRKYLIKHEELYGKTLPISVRFLSLRDGETASIKVDISPDGTYTMKKFRRYGTKERKIKDNSTKISGRLSQVVNTPIGKVIVTPTANYGSFFEKDNGPITVSNSLPFELTSYILSKKYTAELDNKQATIINLSYKDPIPERAVDFLNTLVEVYKEHQVKDKNEVINKTIEFIDQRTVEFEKSLSGYENEIADYQSKHYITEDGDMPSLIMGQAVSSTQEIIGLQTQRVLATYIRSMILKDVHAEQVLPNTGLGNDGIDGQIGSYNSLLMQRKSLIANSSAGNPMVKEIDRQLADMKDIMVKSLDNYVSGIDKRLGMAHVNQDETKGKLAEMPQEALYLRHIGRNRAMAEQMYVYLLQKREDQEMARFNIDKVQLVSPPLGSVKPVSPKTKIILLIALILGLAIPVGIIFVQQSTDNKVRRRKDFDNCTVPFYGEIPFAGKKQNSLPWKKKAPLPVKVLVTEDGNDKVNEALRVLRTKLEAVIPLDRKENVSLITSFDSKSGKSFLTANLGKAFSLKQKKVLVIDCDFRNATASSVLANSSQKGLVDYLSGKEDNIDKLICKYEGSAYYDVLPVGTIPSNPTELLDNEKLKVLIDDLRNKYDYIFIDCPQIDTFADTEIVSKFADRTIFVVRAGQFERSSIEDLQKLCDEGKYKNMLLVLNAAEE